MTCTMCDSTIDLTQPVKYDGGVPYIECECGCRLYADMNAPDEEETDDYQEYLATAQGA